ncbi:MAG: aminotransferase [Clostridia bacterium]|nr:aminotransferase [Clostridia bacterium]
MTGLKSCSVKELEFFLENEKKRYMEFKNSGLSINMARGKPSPEQLDTVEEIMDTAGTGSYIDENGVDTRNYGEISGLSCAKKLFAGILDTVPEKIIIGGNSSLELMFDFLCQCMFSGIGGHDPWVKQGKVKIIAVTPGYDRHFAIAEYLGLEMLCVPIDKNGPDMDMVEQLVRDPMVKSMFCVPKYSNPNGYTYSEETCRRLAALKPAAPDFRCIWDNAYVVHDLYGTGDYLPDILSLSAENGNEDLFVEFASTSKVTFAGAGISCIAASDANTREILARMGIQIISFDKINQLRHVRALPDMDAVRCQMERHAAILRPKFDIIAETLEKELGGLGIASWYKPNGGYFITLSVDLGSAKHVGQLCADAGLTLTKVGAAFPYGKDPDDSVIRLAPSYPSVAELKTATELLCTAVKIAAAEALLV